MRGRPAAPARPQHAAGGRARAGGGGVSFSDRPTLSPGQKFGCFGFGALLFALNAYLLLPYFLPGDCEPNATCKSLGVLSWLPVLSLLAGAGLFWWMTRDRNAKG